MMTKIIRYLVLIIVLFGCLPPQPNISPISPLATPQITAPNHSKLSVMIGNSPTGLNDFLTIAQPTIIYSVNNAVESTIQQYSPHTLLIRRIQNDVWERLPNDWYNGLRTLTWEEEARESARHWALDMTIYVPGRGRLNYVEYVQLSEQDFVAPINEPVIGQGPDRFDKARWIDAWFSEFLAIIHQYHLHGSIYSFPTGEPPIDVVPLLANSARIAALNGDIIDLHEYGVEAELMSSPSSGALRYRQFHDALPVDARPPFIVSEASGGNGYGTGIGGGRWINDMIAYGRELRRDPYLIGAAAFQLDEGAESNIPPTVLHGYAIAAAAIDWSAIYTIYLPVIRR